MRYILIVLGGLIAGALIAFPLGSASALGHFARIDGQAATLFIGYIGASITIGATIIAIWGVYSQRLITRRQTTVQHIFALKADASIQANVKLLIEESRGEKNLAQWADKENIGHPSTLAIIAVLNDYELLSTGIQSGIYDYEIVRKYDASTIKRIWTNTLPFIAALRNRTGVPTLWKEFELLHDWISGTKNPYLILWWRGLA